jgi:hypothetical protein
MDADWGNGGNAELDEVVDARAGLLGGEGDAVATGLLEALSSVWKGRHCRSHEVWMVLARLVLSCRLCPFRPYYCLH